MRPHLEYTNVIWHPTKIKDIIAIENVQRWATKYLPSLKNLSYEERLQKLKLPTLRYRRLRGDMIETYKLMTGKYDHKIVNFMPKPHDSSTSLPTWGHQLKLYRQRAEKNLRNNFFSLQVTSYWNSLPDNVVQAPNIKTFESTLDQHRKEYEGKYNFRSTYSPTANWKPEHEEINGEGAVEEPEIKANACFQNAILQDPTRRLDLPTCFSIECPSGSELIFSCSLWQLPTHSLNYSV